MIWWFGWLMILWDSIYCAICRLGVDSYHLYHPWAGKKRPQEGGVTGNDDRTWVLFVKYPKKNHISDWWIRIKIQIDVDVAIYHNGWIDVRAFFMGKSEEILWPAPINDGPHMSPKSFPRLREVNCHVPMNLLYEFLLAAELPSILN